MARPFKGSSPEQVAGHGKIDHRLRHVEALLIIADEPAPACHSAEGPLNHPAPRQHLEAGDVVRPPDDLDGKVAQSGRIEQLGAIVGPIAKQVLEPSPATPEIPCSRLSVASEACDRYIAARTACVVMVLP
jgi:hypothetical protein